MVVSWLSFRPTAMAYLSVNVIASSIESFHSCGGCDQNDSEANACFAAHLLTFIIIKLQRISTISSLSSNRQNERSFLKNQKWVDPFRYIKDWFSFIHSIYTQKTICSSFADKIPWDSIDDRITFSTFSFTQVTYFLLETLLWGL